MVFKPVKQNRIAVEIVNQLKAAILSGPVQARRATADGTQS